MSLRILHTAELYAPSVGGAQEVVRQVSERLVARGHDVTVATAALPGRDYSELHGVRIAEFDVGGNAVRGIRGDVEPYRRFVREGDFDVVMAYAAQQWAADALLDQLGAISAATILAPCGFSGLHDPAYAGYFAGLRDQLTEFDALIFHSATYQDHAFAVDAGATRRTLIPNGADEAEFATLAPRGRFRAAHRLGERDPLLLTIGGHTGLKGHAQAMAAFRTSRAARRGALALIGNTPTGRGCLPLCTVRAAATRVRRPGRRVLLLDPARPQVLEAYADADLFVFCSMIECSPLVLFEAMAAGLPFVSADVGNAREIAEWSGGGVIAPTRRLANGLVEPDVEAVRDLIDELLADPDRRAELGASGRRAWEERFRWDHVASQYEALYESVAGR
jgi:glycosyltransferase involved in cell wall biosynthesis